MSRKAAICARLWRGRDYDRHAGVQRRVAASLAERIARSAPVRPTPRARCRRGNRLHDRAAGAAAGRSALGGQRSVDRDGASRPRHAAGGQRGFRRDGCSAAVLCRWQLRPGSARISRRQWFDDLPGSVAALGALVAPGGLLRCRPMANGSFADWRAAHEALGLTPATPEFPDTASLAGIAPAGMTGTVVVDSILQRHSDAADLLRICADLVRPSQGRTENRSARARCAR